MKHIINYICGILLIISAPSWACNNLITKENADKAISGDISARSGCPKGEKCYCYDTIDWESADWKDEIVNGDPIYTVNSQSACADEQACQLAMSELQCDIGFTARYRMDNPQVFCERLDGYEQIRTGEKALKNSSEKMAAKIAKEEKKAQVHAAKKANRAKLIKELKDQDYTLTLTAAQLRVIVKKLVDVVLDDQ